MSLYNKMFWPLLWHKVLHAQSLREFECHSQTGWELMKVKVQGLSSIVDYLVQ